MSRDLTLEPVLALDDIQGNIVPGLRKDFQSFAFFRIEDAAGARAFLRSVAPEVASARCMLAAHAHWKARRAALGREPGADIASVFLNLAITGRALVALGRQADLDVFADKGLRFGLAARSGLIGDPIRPALPGHPEQWLFGAGEREVDILLIGASDHAARLEERLTGWIAAAADRGLRLVHVDRGAVGAAPAAGHEQFGFRIGISQPALRGRRGDAVQEALEPDTWPPDPAFDALRANFAAPGRQLIWPGEIVFGYPRQMRDDPLRADPRNVPKGPDWARNGALLVYRRLRQFPENFEAFLARAEAQIRLELPHVELTAHELGARLVGRWRSGAPVMRSPDRDSGLTGPAANHFRFSEPLATALPGDGAPLGPGDFDGARCPLAAHIRKVNPRDDVTDLGGPERTVPKLILRRGIAYREAEAEADAGGTVDRGMLFLAYQSSIEQQFEFLMRAWVKDPDRPRDGAGQDPLLSHGSCNFVRLAIEGQSIAIPFHNDWVIPTGGAYLFAPSLSALRSVLGEAHAP